MSPAKIIELSGDVTIDDVTAGVIVDIMAEVEAARERESSVSVDQ